MVEQALPCYSGSNALCPKCATTSAASITYHAAGTTGCTLTQAEHQHRTCQVCRFEWAESPVG